MRVKIKKFEQKSSKKLAAWLGDREILQGAEIVEFGRTGRFPVRFRERVLARQRPGVGQRNCDNVIEKQIMRPEVFGPAIASIPVTGSTLPAPLFRAPERSPSISIYEAAGAKIFVGFNQTTLILDEGSYFEGVSTSESHWIAPVFGQAPPNLTLKGTAAVLFADGASLFSHWMFDLLPKLEILRLAEWNPSRVDYYIVNSLTAPFHTETLSTLGIPPEKVVVGGGNLISAERLLIPSPVRGHLRTPGWVRRFIREAFHTSVDHQQPGASGSLQIYISRSKARRRRVLNEPEVCSILERAGFTTVFAEDVSVTEMAKLVSRATRIVAPHGAGVMNAVFAEPGTRLLETYGAHISSEGWLMTVDGDAHHYVLAGKDAEGYYPWESRTYAAMNRTEKNVADYLLDPLDLQKALRAMNDI